MLTVLIGLSATSLASAAEPAPIEQVISAERHFAMESVQRGSRRAFLAWVAPDGFLIEGKPVPARSTLDAVPDRPNSGPPLFWWPLLAGVAGSGDLGFTTGGATVSVRYFTVWQRQAGGEWRWIYDGGPRLAAPLAPSEEPVRRLPPATANSGSASAAIAEVERLERAIALGSESDSGEARRPFLAADALVGGSLEPTHPGQWEAELQRQPKGQRMRPLGRTGSKGGDLVFSWGEVEWGADEAPRKSHYVRIWQNRREGWRLVVDLLVGPPFPAPIASSTG